MLGAENEVAFASGNSDVQSCSLLLYDRQQGEVFTLLTVLIAHKAFTVNSSYNVWTSNCVYV